MVNLVIDAPDADLVATGITSSFHNIEAAMLNVVMNNQPGIIIGMGANSMNWRDAIHRV